MFHTCTAACARPCAISGNDKAMTTLTYQGLRCRIPHYIQKFLAPADKFIRNVAFLCPSMYVRCDRDLSGTAGV